MEESFICVAQILNKKLYTDLDNSSFKSINHSAFVESWYQELVNISRDVRIFCFLRKSSIGPAHICRDNVNELRNYAYFIDLKGKKL